jgi:hypothetical protein
LIFSVVFSGVQHLFPNSTNRFTMLKIIVRVVVLILLALVPFLGTAFVAGYSPYREGNTLESYIAASFAAGFVSLLVLLLALNRKLSTAVMAGGFMFFLIGLIMASVLGLGPPQIGPEMLQHTEREHYRYFILLLNAALFTAGFLLIAKERKQEFSSWNRWLLVLFVPAMVLLSLELVYHYHYAEGLKAWIEQGERAEGFEKHYDNQTVVNLGCIGRCFQYGFLALFFLVLHRFNHIRKGTLITLIFLSAVGMISAITILVHGMQLPTAIQFLLAFFIPGAPFLLLYWAGMSLLTKPAH